MAYRNGPHLITEGLIGMIDPGTTKCQPNVPMQNRSNFISNWSLKRSTVTTVTGTIDPPDSLPADTPVYSLKINTSAHANGLHRATNGAGGFVSLDPDLKVSGTRWNVWVRGKSGNSSLTAQIDIGDDGGNNNDSATVSANETWQYLSAWNSNINTASNFFDLVISPYTDNANVLYICGDTIAQSNSAITANLQAINTDPIFIDHLGKLGTTPPNLVDRSKNWEINETKWLSSSGTYLFDAEDMYIEASTVLNTDLNPTSMSIDAWVKYSDFSVYGVIAARWSATSAEQAYFLSNYIGTGNIDWYIKTPAHATTASNLRGNVEMLVDYWYNVVATYDSSTNTMKLYANGIAVSTDTPPITPSGDIDSTTSKTGFGRDIQRDNYQFDGEMGAVKIYDRALTADEVLQSFNSLKSNFGDLYSIDATLVIDRMTGLVTKEKIAIAKFVDSQVASGNWVLLDEFIHYGLQTSGNSLIGWKFATQTAYNTPTHISGVGYSFDGASSNAQRIDSELNDTTDVVKYTLDDGLIGAFVVQNDELTATRAIIEVVGGVRTAIRQSPATTRISFKVNSTGSSAWTTGDAYFAANALYIAVRESSSSTKLYKNSTSVRSEGDVSTGRDNANFTISGNGEFAGTLSSFVVGAAVGFNHSNFYDNLVILNKDLKLI